MHRCPVQSSHKWPCVQCQAVGFVSNLQREHSNQPGVPSPRLWQAAQKRAPLPKLWLVLCSWWNRSHGWEEEEGVCQRGGPRAILRCHTDTWRNYKKKNHDTATHTTQHSEPCTMNTTPHKVRAALAFPSHPLEKPACPLRKAEILVLC